MRIDLSLYPPCGPYVLDNPSATEPMEVRDTLGGFVGTVPPGRRAYLFVKEDGAGNRTPLLVA